MEDADITAAFSEEEHRLAGSAGCNRYFGVYERDGGALTFSQMGATRRACPPPVMEQEQAYLSALESVQGWTRSGSQLTLTAPKATRGMLGGRSAWEF